MANFHELIQKNTLVLVDFTASWCGPCQMLAPILKEVKEEIGDQVTILKIDVDKNRTLAEYFRVQGVPTLILFSQGQQVWRQSGVLSKKELIKLIHQHSALVY